MGLLTSAANGATERPGSSNESIMLFFAGPIRYWWRPDVEGTRSHTFYMAQREKIFMQLSENFLVYAPYRAIRGPWDSRAQLINDAAVARSDAFVYLNAGVPMTGTKQERSLAETLHIPIFDLFVGDNFSSDAQLTKLVPLLNDVRRRK